MKFFAESNDLEKQSGSCIITSIFESCYLSSATKYLDKISNGYISTILHHEKLYGKLGQTLLLYNVPNVTFERILLIGCGKKNELDEHQYKLIFQNTINRLNNTTSTEAVCFLIELHVRNRNTYWKIRQAIETIEENLYSFNQLKTNNNKLCHSLQKIIFNIPNNHEVIIGKHAIRHSSAISAAIKMAKDLGNMPPNICNTTYLTSRARQLSTLYNNTTTCVISAQQMHKLGMHTYLAVGSGSQNEPLMSVIKYRGNSDHKSRPIILIGKGLTFDSGGISIKNAESMDEMKYDMCGAAVVYGIMHVVNKLELPLNIFGILACCENMPSERAYRPGDILTTMSGQTVEILNTDAEGRLVLCDVLTYVERFEPEIVIDIATLTGSCVIALGHHITGLMSNNDLLANELLIASEQTNDLAWRLPLNNEFQKQLESNFADMTNVGGRAGGTITAGCFLSRFTNKYNWAHLDIAGTAWRSGNVKGATGRPIAMLSQFLLNKSGFSYEK